MRIIKRFIIALTMFGALIPLAYADCPTPTPRLMTVPITPVQTTVAHANIWLSDTRGELETYSLITASMPVTVSGWLTSVSDINMPFRYLAGFQRALDSEIPLLGGLFALFILIIQWRFAVIIIKFLIENANNIKNLVLDVWNAIPFKFS